MPLVSLLVLICFLVPLPPSCKWFIFFSFNPIQYWFFGSVITSSFLPVSTLVHCYLHLFPKLFPSSFILMPLILLCQGLQRKEHINQKKNSMLLNPSNLTRLNPKKHSSMFYSVLLYTIPSSKDELVCRHPTIKHITHTHVYVKIPINCMPLFSHFFTNVETTSAQWKCD